MAPKPSPTKQDTHQPHPSYISPVPDEGHIALPSTPARNIYSGTPRRQTRQSEQDLEVQTLPGTRWDELDIDRHREKQRGREPTSDLIAAPSLSRLSLREKSVQLSTQRSTVTRDIHLKPGRRQTHRQAQQSASHSAECFEENSEQVLGAAPSPTKKRRLNRSLSQTCRGPTGRPSESSSQAGVSPSSLIAGQSLEKSLPPNMARRPGRNQVDYVAELKETIHESLSKLSDIQEKLGPIGQQILTLEEELKAKESDSSKLDRIHGIFQIHLKTL
jgi:hypothetical protein